jgi:hypothetical protein
LVSRADFFAWGAVSVDSKTEFFFNAEKEIKGESHHSQLQSPHPNPKHMLFMSTNYKERNLLPASWA